MKAGLDPAAWHDWFLATAGIGAALAGLVFVALSINLRDILRMPQVVGRAAEALTLLLSIAAVAIVGLWPARAGWIGEAILIVGAVTWVSVVYLVTRSGAAAGASRGQTVARIALGQIATLPTVAAGILLVWGREPGLNLLVVATFGSLIAGVAGAWVLLVEILR